MSSIELAVKRNKKHTIYNFPHEKKLELLHSVFDNYRNSLEYGFYPISYFLFNLHTM